MKYCIIVLVAFSICTSQEEGYIDSTKVRNPSLAWKLGIIPGIGQLYNGKYIKSVGFICVEYFTVSRFIELNENNRKDPSKGVGLRNTYAWWVFGLFVWNILDAYVDAQLSTFPVKRLESNIGIDSLKVQPN